MIQRRKSADELLDVSMTVKLSEKLVAALEARREETGVPVSTQVRRAIERELAGHMPESGGVSATGKHVVSFEFSEPEMEKLREVAGMFNLPETNWFARMLVLTNLAHPLEELRAFLFAPLKTPQGDAKDGGGESDDNHTQETGNPAPAPKRRRKVA